MQMLARKKSKLNFVPKKQPIHAEEIALFTYQLHGSCYECEEDGQFMKDCPKLTLYSKNEKHSTAGTRSTHTQRSCKLKLAMLTVFVKSIARLQCKL